jgi:signal transduction histidine kinase
VTVGGRVAGVVTLIYDITARKAAEAEREALLRQEQAARAEAQAAVLLREQFLAIASHELRTPLTTIKGYIQLLGRQLRRAEVEPARTLAQVEQLERQVGRFERLVRDLLDVSRLRGGGLPLEREAIDLSALAGALLARFEAVPERTPAHRLTLLAPAPVVAVCDGDRIEQVLTNLLANALKFSPDGGEVRLTVRAAGDRAEIVVSDQGIGIQPGEVGALFRPFARAGRARTGLPGLGLGLYIAAQIVERHGGGIAVDSTPGGGATFTVRLPLTPPSDA